MAVIYANKIIREAGQPNAFTIDNVPGANWKNQTLQILADRGYDGYGNPL